MTKRTTRTTGQQNRRVSQNAGRLRRYLYRAIRIFVVLGIVVWAGSWLWMGGFVGRAGTYVYDRMIAWSVDAGFTVQNVLVEGRVNTDADVIMAILNVDKGDPIMAFHTRAAREMIEKITWVKGGSVERRLPDTIYVNIIEHQPYALWQKDKKVTVINDEGKVLSRTNLSRFKKLLLVVGNDANTRARDIKTLLHAEPVVEVLVKSASYVSGRRWDLHLENGMVLKLPEHDAEMALSKIARFQIKDNILAKDIKIIDLRDPSRIVVEARPGAAKTLETDLNKKNI